MLCIVWSKIVVDCAPLTEPFNSGFCSDGCPIRCWKWASLSVCFSREAGCFDEIFGCFQSMLEYQLVPLSLTGCNLKPLFVFFLIPIICILINFPWSLPTVMNSNNESHLSPSYNNNNNNIKKGETGANVLVGIQVPLTEMDEFRDRANNLGYSYTEENSNEAFQLLMHWVGLLLGMDCLIILIWVVGLWQIYMPS